MNMHTTRKTFSIVIFAAGILVGCEGQSKPALSVNDVFVPDDQPRSLDALYAQQTANGAREDGTLYPQHFTDGQLNSLGYRKLAAMLYGPETGKLAVYLDVPSDAGYAACESSVTTYLTQKGLASNAFTITAGANPNTGAPAAPGLAALAKQSKSGGAAGDSASADAGAMGASK